MKTAQVAAAASGEFTAVHAPRRGGIAGQHGQPHVVTFCFQPGALLSVAFSRSDLLLVSFDPTLFSHKRVGGTIQQTYPCVKDESVFFYSFLLKSV